MTSVLAEQYELSRKQGYKFPSKVFHWLSTRQAFAMLDELRESGIDADYLNNWTGQSMAFVFKTEEDLSLFYLRYGEILR
jgi:hypothetical protein